MELVSPFHAVLSSCSREALLPPKICSFSILLSIHFCLAILVGVIAPSRRASASARHKEKRGLVCVLGGERGGCNGERKDVVDGRIRRRAALALLLASPALSVAFTAHGKTKTRNPYDERRLLEQNKKIQEANRAPDDFPNFIREGVWIDEEVLERKL